MINDINLIPKGSKKEARKEMLSYAFVYLWLVVVLVFAGYLIPLLQKSQTASRIAEKEYELQKYRDTDESYIQLTNTLADMKDRVAYFELLRNSLKMSQIFKDMETNIPQGINISNMSLIEGTLNISGDSPSYKEVAQFIVKLRGLDYVNNINFSNAALEDEEENADELYNFNMIVTLNISEPAVVPEGEAGGETDADTKEEGEASENEAN